MRTLATAGLMIWMTAAALGAVAPDTASAPVVGELTLPRWDWRMYGPVGRDAPVPDPAVFKTVPAELTIGGKTFKPRPLSVEDRFCRINLANVIGGTEIGKTVYVVVPFNAPADMEATFGFGADWWLQVWLDGVAILDTLKAGNEAWPPTVLDHRKTVKLAKGRHVLVVRFISGGGSSILAIGGPGDIRRGPPPYTLSLFQNVPMPPGNLITNGGFETGAAGDPFVPDGWANGPRRLAFRPGELTARTNAPIYGARSLEINTLDGRAAKRKLLIPFKADVDTCYEIRFKASHLEGDGFASVSVRDSRAGRFDTGFIRAIGANNTYDRYNQAIKKGQLGAAKAYYFFDTTDPCLVIQTHGPVHAVIDDVSIVPVERIRMYDSWDQQLTPEKTDWNALGDAVVTPHTAWAKPYAGGTLKVISLMPRKKHRMTVELAQRLSMEYTPIFLEWDRSPNGPSVLGHDYWVYDAEGDPLLFDKAADTLQRLAQPADCMVIAELHASAITPAMSKAILKRVSEGVGLVIMASPYIVKDLPAFTTGAWAKALNQDNRTTNGIDWVRLDAASVYQTAGHTPSFYEFGKGRIVLWSAHIGADQPSLESNLPAMMRAMLWSARKGPAVRIGGIVLPGSPIGVLSSLVPRPSLPGPVKVSLAAVPPLAKNTKVTGWVDDFNGKPAVALGKVAPTGAVPTAVFELPPLPIGKHRLHFQVTRGRQVEDWSTAVLEVTMNTVVKAIALDRTNRLFTAGEPIVGQVALREPLQPGRRLRVQLMDADGRLWATNEFAGSGTEFAFQLPTDPTVVLMHKVQAAILEASGCVVEEASTPCAVVRSPAWYDAGFDFQLWCIPNDSYPVTRELRNLGVTSDYHGFLCENHALNNIRGGPGVGLHYEAENAPGIFFPYHRTAIVGDNAHAPVRYPCLSDPAYLSQMAQATLRDVGSGTRYAPRAYSLAHEWNYRGFGSLSGPVDICFCSNSLASFRRFVRQEYGTLDRLNASWGSAFTTWEAVTPLILADAIKTNQIPRWVDHRRHADQVFADFFKTKLKALRQVDPNAEGGGMNLRVGPTTLDSYSGVDFWKLYHEVGIFAYLENPYVLAFTPRDSARRHLLSQILVMWHTDRYTGNRQLSRVRAGNLPWSALLAGAHGYTYYEEYFFMPPNRPFKPILNADLTASENIRTLASSVTQIRGICRFLYEGQRSDSGIALLYSRSSEHAATAWQALQTNSLASRISPPGQMGFYTGALAALGYQYAAISDFQMASGTLTNRGYRLLILPVAQAISPDAAIQIREFVRAGGHVLADIRPGMGDLHGHVGAAGMLDDVFGVRHQTAYTDYTAVEDRLRLDGPVGAPATGAWQAAHAICGPALALAGAAPLGCGERSGRPVWLTHRFGRGGATLLNFVMPQIDASALSMMRDVLNAIGLHPLFDIAAPERVPVRSQRVIAADAADTPADAEGYISMRNSVAKPILTDFINGRIHCFGFWHPSRRGVGRERLVITPPVSGHIYDLKTNGYLGRKDRFAFDLPLEDAGLFASVPYQIQRPVLTLATDQSKGGLPAIQCWVNVRPAEAASENHVIQFRLFAPDGIEWPEFTATETARAGKAGHLFVLPLEAPAGRWRVEARETISGLSVVEHWTR